MNKLKLLALKRRENIETDRPEIASFDDMVLADFASTLSRMDRSERVVTVQIADGLSIEAKIPVLQEVSWAYHLTHMRCVFEQIPHDDVDVSRACRAMMLAEGWVFSDHALKTPAWMIPSAEISYGELESHGFDWITVSDR